MRGNGIMNCDWKDNETADASGWRSVRCQRCGFVTGKTPHSHDKIYRECNVKGLGDYVAAGLRILGFKKKCAACQKRQDALNEAGKKIGF